MPNLSINTDHKAVITTIRTNRRRKQRSCKNMPCEIVNLKNLKDEAVRENYEKELNEIFVKLPKERKTVEEEWEMFKSSILNTAKTTCGTTKKHKTRIKKITSWWNDEVKEAVKDKKGKYKKWVKSKQDRDYIEYRLARRHANRIIKKEKQKDWEEYGETLNKNYKEATRNFYKKINAMRTRTEPFDPTEIINSEKGEPISEQKQILKRWRQYFEQLLNIPSEATGTQ